VNRYKVVRFKAKKSVAEELESLLNEHADQGWQFVEMEQEPGNPWLIVVFSRS
jgi:hypothetical protein